MDNALEDFTARISAKLLPVFCHDEKRGYPVEGFKASSIKVAEVDAYNFLRALDNGVVTDIGGGRYRCARSNATEQIFWEGQKSISPRPITLWLEPVITIATVARLALDYGWPGELLSMQSEDWAFDFAVYDGEASRNEYIAGEVKKTRKEVDTLIEDLNDFAHKGQFDCEGEPPKRVNSFKKWKALLDRQAPLFWAVGPDDYTHLFKVQYAANHTAKFIPVDLSHLKSKHFVSL